MGLKRLLFFGGIVLMGSGFAVSQYDKDNKVKAAGYISILAGGVSAMAGSHLKDKRVENDYLELRQLSIAVEEFGKELNKSIEEIIESYGENKKTLGNVLDNKDGISYQTCRIENFKQIINSRGDISWSLTHHEEKKVYYEIKK